VIYTHFKLSGRTKRRRTFSQAGEKEATFLACDCKYIALPSCMLNTFFASFQCGCLFTQATGEKAFICRCVVWVLSLPLGRFLAE
jgi:hypothetical protein